MNSVRHNSLMRYFFIIFLTLISIGNKYTLGQTARNDSVSYNLPEIIVTATPLLVPSATIIREANTKDFEVWNSHNAAEALSQSVGMNIQVGSQTGEADVWVRGFINRDVLTLFDGIPISSAFGGNIDLNEVSISNIARIKMIKSAPSVIYGSNAMGGVIDIIPKTGLTYNVKKITAEVSKNNSHLVRANYGNNSKYFNYFLSANYESTDGYTLPRSFSTQQNEGGGIRDNSDYLRRNLFIHINSNFEPVGRLSIFFNHSDGERGFSPQVGVSEPDYMRLTDSKRQTIGLSNSLTVIPIAFRLFYNSYQSEETTFKDSTFTEITDVHLAKDYAYGLMLYSKFVTSKSNVLIANFSLKNDVYEADGDLENVSKANIHTHTFAVEDEISIKRLSVSAGGIFTIFQQPQLTSKISAFDGQIVAGYHLNQNFFLHASAAQRTRFPQIRELYRSKYGNPNLREQRANNYELGLSFTNSQRIQTDLVFFYNRLNDLIERKTRRSIYENIDGVTYKGFEFSFGAWFTDRFFGRSHYTFLEAPVTFSDGASRQLRSRPKHSFGLELRHKFPFRIFLSLNGIYVAEVFDLDDNENYVQLPNYLLLHAKASMDINKIFNVYIAANNLTDKNYSHRIGFPREGRIVRFGLYLGL